MSIFAKPKVFNPEADLSVSHLFVTRVSNQVAVDNNRVAYVSHVSEPLHAERRFVTGELVDYTCMAQRLREAGYQLRGYAKPNSTGKPRGGNASIPTMTEMWVKEDAE